MAPCIEAGVSSDGDVTEKDGGDVVVRVETSGNIEESSDGNMIIAVAGYDTGVLHNSRQF